MEIICSPPKSMATHQLRATCMCLTFFIWLQLAMVSPVCGASLRVQKHLQRFNKPAISTIESPDGDMIDCILMSQQPAFDHPLLKDHKIQMQANYPEGLSEFKAAKESSEYSFLGDDNVAEEQKKPQQLWHNVGASCPHGTIPIRRTTERDLLRTKRMDKYGRKFHLPPKPASAPSAAAASLADQSAHQHAIAYVQGGKYYGAKANINVWNPSIQVSNEFSLSQLWILGGSFNSNLNSIEAGWQVSPDLYGDNNTRLFIYWTSDAYQATGCYNLLCSGFVQVSDQIAIGATISPVSTYGNSQYDITILIWKDPKQGNWWMQFGNKYILGYWPAALFTTLSNSASMVEWGGEVVNSQPGGQHTATQMGSGHFPSEAFGKSSYFSHLQVVDANNNLLSSGDVSTFAERPACYDVQSSSSSDWGNYFYYGGPGRNPNCL